MFSLLLFSTAHSRCTILISNYIQTYWQNVWISRILVFRFATVHFPIQSDLLALHLTGFPQTQRPPLRQWQTGCLRVKWKKGSSLLASRNRDGAVQRVLENNISPSATIVKRFVKRSLTGIFLPNQFSAALPIFSGTKRGGAEPPQIFVYGGFSPPCPTPLPPIRRCSLR